MSIDYAYIVLYLRFVKSLLLNIALLIRISHTILMKQCMSFVTCLHWYYEICT